MVCALLVDNPLEAALPLVEVVGDIGNKVSVPPFAFSHHSVFIVAKIGTSQPQRPVLLIGMAVRCQSLDGSFNIVPRVQ